MITVLEAIRLSTEYLDKKKIDSPRINAELLLAHIIGCKRLDLYLAFDRPLTEPELNIYRGLIKRRASYEPLQYIIGTVEFYGLVFKVTSSVLIPRPETELLVENIIKELSDKEQLNILEIGCGSGNIAISLAYHLKQAQIITTDISDAALNLAKENSQKLGVAERISFIRHNILTDDLLRFSMFDLVVSNPPYVSLQSYSSLQKEIMDFEPRLAVTDESDGLTFYRIISEKVSGNIKKGGKLFFEISHGQCDDVEVIKDYQNIERIVFGEFK
ncbi:MAG: peptide chain release factor N(5)-glutamine methyltransferase [Ignavibacteriaceae bacterium]|nr:peptide chain release factor N(5)-glutamine methyltransferase [Ignavibacteriaceae bacterium]